MTDPRLEALEQRVTAIEARLGDPAAERAAREAIVLRIVDAVAAVRNVPRGEIVGAARDHQAAAARAMICWIARQATTISIYQLGGLLGGRDHTTVRSAIARAEQLRARDPDFREAADQILASTRGGAE